MLENCLPCRKGKHTHYMEKVWGSFHQERCSVQFKSLWSSFLLESIGCTDINPIFYQYVTDFMFKVVLRQKLPIEERDHQEVQKEVLSYEEKNVIRFIGGYILRALRKKVERSSQPHKKELLLCLCDMLEDDTDTSFDESSDWMSIKDRGGLNRVTHSMFLLISCMEIEVKHHLATNTSPDNFNIKEVLSTKIKSNEEVEYYWNILSANWEEDDGKILLSMIIDHWITIRGFAYTGTWMEKYKSFMHKKVQKSKGIRKMVIGSTSTNEDNIH